MSSRRPNLPNSAVRKKPTANPLDIADRTPYLKRRSTVYAVGVAVIAAAGALAGAALKSRQQAVEIKEVKQKQEIDVGSRISFLESRRGQLQQEKFQLEKKIASLRERQEKKRKMELERQRLGLDSKREIER